MKRASSLWAPFDSAWYITRHRLGFDRGRDTTVYRVSYRGGVHWDSPPRLLKVIITCTYNFDTCSNLQV